MAEVKGGYQRPTTSTYISDTFQGHKNRPKPSTEPGTDYGVAYGSNVYAAEDGIVSLVDHTTAGAEGRRLSIALYDGQMTSDIHLSRILVNSGQKVKRGDLVAKTGASAWGKEWGVGAHVHRTLFPTHQHIFGTHKTLDFELYVGADNDGLAIAYSQTVANEQNYLNAARGEKLVVDGLRGPATIAATKRYQTYLTGRGWYSGAIDGIWGPGTQSGHEKAYAEWVAATQAPPSPQYHNATVADLASLPNTRGLQKIARLYGYTGPLDNIFGAGSRTGLQKFLNQNYGGSLPAWLRAKWGYVGNDQWGPVMAAAATRADTANWAAL
jgi:hypothetical protein